MPQAPKFKSISKLAPSESNILFEKYLSKVSFEKAPSEQDKVCKESP
jgi:hypothetical protein